MPDDKGLGSKILGLFIESPDAPTPAEGTEAGGGEPSAADLVAELAGQSAPAKKPAAAGGAATSTATSIPLPPAGSVAPASVDFDAVFRGAGMDVAELERVRKAEDLLKGLPEATPLDVKRQIVETSLRTFGVEVTRIVGAAQHQLKALDTYVRLNEQQTAKSIADAQQQIARLEDQVISLKAEMAKKTEQHAAIIAAAAQRKGEVNRVLAFFHTAPQAAPDPGGSANPVK